MTMAVVLPAACGFVWVVGAQTPPAPTPLQAPSASGQAEAAARRASDRIVALQREAEVLAQRETTLLGELRQLEIQRDLSVEELASIELDLRAVTRDKDDLMARQRVLEQRVKAARPALQARMVALYKLGQGGYLRLLFGVDDLRAASRAYRTVSVMARQDHERAAAFRATLSELRTTSESVGERQTRIAALAAAARRARRAAEEAVSARNRLIAQIDERRDLNAQMVGELETARQRLRTLATASGGAAPALPLRPFRGALDWPAEGRLASRFGSTPARPSGSPYAAGILIASERGRPVRAIHEGVVTFSEPFAGFGNLVIVDHGSQAFSLYGHLGTLLVDRGAPVGPGQAVGTVGSSPTGNPELYFEIRIDGKPVDPLQWLKRAN